MWKYVTPFFGPLKRSPRKLNATGSPRIELGSDTVWRAFVTCARLVFPSLHEFEIASAIISNAVNVGGPKPIVSPYSFVNVLRYGLATFTLFTSAPKYVRYAPGKLNCFALKLPSATEKVP